MRLTTLLMCVAWLMVPTASLVAAEEGDKPKADSEPTSATGKDEVLAGHSYHGEVFNEGPRQAAYLMEGTGNIDFPVKSDVPQVQEFINQGVGQLHGFWYFESERSFRQAAALDPNCAAAYWGMAMSNANNRDRAAKFIKEAQERKDNASPRVQRYIDALANLLKKKKKSNTSAQEYIKALERIVYDYPDDINAQAFIALQIWQGRRTGIKISSHLAVDGLIKQVLQVDPLHPVHHYCIHLWDSERPQRALESAAKCGEAAPGIAHMWHMPGHIYSKLKRYPDAVWQQEASARTDHAQMMRDGLLPDQIHNFAHNNEWLIRNLIFVGRIDDAADLAKNMLELPRHPKYNTLAKGGTSAAFGRLRLVQVLTEAELWHDTIQLANTPYLDSRDRPDDKADRLRLLGRAYLQQGDVQNGTDVITQLEVLLCERFGEREHAIREAEKKAADEKKSEKDRDKAVSSQRSKHRSGIRRIEQALNELYGMLAIQNGSHEKALELLSAAGRTSPYRRASVNLEIGKTDEAVKLVEDHAKSRKNQTIPLAWKAAILWRAGRVDEAKQTMQTLRKISPFIDLHAAPFARLNEIASELGWPKDWRVEFETSEDFGERPELDNLGPFRWQPTDATDWTLTRATGETISLKQYRERGKPVIVIFYLGYGCLHCAEQLQAFGPRAKDFADEGIEIVAISSDDLDGLKKSIENYDGGAIPFPIASDSQLDVFRKYRAYDDFEKLPLHGTFLIDAKGRIRWHDISYEPFMDPEFVLNEAKRLFSQSDADNTQATFAKSK